MDAGETILWRRLDLPGHEIATVSRATDGWLIVGVALFASAGAPCRLTYEVRCDSSWVTRACVVHGAIGARLFHVDIARDASGRWLRDGVEAAAVHGCVDVDLAFSPVTNLVPVRRLALPVGAAAVVRAAWLRFPEFTLEVLEQSYAHTANDLYHYESAGGAFRRELTVDTFGCVMEYPGLWTAEATTHHGTPTA